MTARTQGSSLLKVQNLTVSFESGREPVTVVDGVSFDLERGEVLGVVGESGSGKSVTMASITGLAQRAGARVRADAMLFEDADLLTIRRGARRALLGSRIGVVFQDPMTALNPVIKIGHQVAEAVRTHHPNLSRQEIRAKAVGLLELVGVPHASERFDQYPHEYSGGMRQRTLIAMAIANDPDLLIADEPTTALDVTIQAEILEVIRDIQARMGMAVVLITHDLGVIAEVADRVLVMYAGEVVESCPVDDIFHAPLHPYTASLLRSRPTLEGRSSRLEPIPGAPASPEKFPSGCRFHPRCPMGRSEPRCVQERPVLRAEFGHPSACHFADRVAENFPGSHVPTSDRSKR